MKTLFLMRHAKSSWKDEKLADFDRPLNSRGKAAAEAMGKLFLRRKLAPTLVLSSPALRARETTAIVLKAARVNPELRFDQRIYEAGPLRLLEIISEVEDSARSILLVGHNPGMSELLQILTGKAEQMSTANLAKINLQATKWSKTIEEGGKLDWLVRPKELVDL